LGGEKSKGVIAVVCGPAGSDVAGAIGEDTSSMLCGLTGGEPANEEVTVSRGEETSGVTELIRDGGIEINTGVAAGALPLEVVANKGPPFARKQVSSNTTFLDK
jgi:hypothetical protein